MKNSACGMISDGKTKMNYVGIDIGSTASKVVVRGDTESMFVTPTGWSSKETAREIKQRLQEIGVDVESEDTVVVSTGYGRVAVDFSDYVITEITCHGEGGKRLFENDCTIIDIGGQDTKIIIVENGVVTDFIMNDKCSAGTGKFVEIMANRLGYDISELFESASKGKVLPISSLCTVFAESEIINYIGQGNDRHDIAAGVVDSVAMKVSQPCSRKNITDDVILTGGLSDNEFFAGILSKKIKRDVKTFKLGRYAGALGASYIAEKKSKKRK